MKAYQEHGSYRKAAKALSIDESTLRQAVQRLQRKAAVVDPAQHSDRAPLGYHLRGVSTMNRTPDGGLQWVKTQRDHVFDPEALLKAFQDLLAGAEVPHAKLRREPPKVDPLKMAVYPMGDPHLGMLAWGKETGADFDLEIAERNLFSAVDHLVDLAPLCETACIINVGDFFHSDNEEHRTTRSGNALDVDSRYHKILRVGSGAMVRCCDRALEKHRRVRVVNAKGNHDDNGSQFLALLLAEHYRNEPRIEIDTSPSPYYWHRFGRCLIGVTHGHTVKAADLPLIMAHDRAKDWGETEFRHFYTGHFHHERVREFPGCTVETVRTLAARDAWHHSKGYRSRRAMTCDIWHAERGLILTHNVDVEALE